jgi:hypothetical protein
MSIEWEYVSELRPLLTYYSFPAWYMNMEDHGGMISTAEDRRTRTKTFPTATLSTRNPTTAWAMARPKIKLVMAKIMMGGQGW